MDPYIFKIELPKLLLLGYRDINAFIAWHRGHRGWWLPFPTALLRSLFRTQERGLKATRLADYQMAKEEGRDADAANHEIILRENHAHFGYGYLETEEDMIPNIPLTTVFT